MLAASRRLAPLLRLPFRAESSGPIDETVDNFLSADFFFNQLKSRGYDFFAGVPDSLLKDFNTYVSENTTEAKHIIAVNEGAAMAVAAGYHLATGKFPVVYLQNSGLGNIINPLLSLIDPKVYKIPMLLLIGWRGEPGTKDEPQHMVQGKVMNNLLTDLGVTYEVLPNFEEGSSAALDLATYHLRSRGSPYAFLVRRQTFLKYKGRTTLVVDHPMCREEAIRLVLSKTGKFDAFVATTGFTSRELYELREKAGQGHEQDFYTVGSMGYASSIAMGIALAKPSKNVYCLDGDGAFLMHMGAAAQIGARPLLNFKHILLNNECHDSVGGQPTISGKVDFVGMARACGYKFAHSARTKEEMLSKIEELTKADGPAFLELKVCRRTRDDLGRPKSSPRDNKESLMDFLDA